MRLSPNLRPSDRLAALPIYDSPELHAANDALWRAISTRLTVAGVHDVPPALTRSRSLDVLWRDQRLLLAQSCGYPLVTSLRDAVKVVATPRYRVPGCAGPFYRSAIIVAATNRAASLAELRGSRCVANEPSSNSGVNLLRATITPLANGQKFFRQVLWSGSHWASLAMIADDEADVAAIDCVTFEHLRKTAPALVAAVRVLTWSEASPGLPLITAAATDDQTVETLRAALADIVTDRAAAPALQTLLIEDFDTLPRDTYQDILEIERRARALGYPELA
jgi:ABC-type phosphate/phosphonate transport system substrate-binding protein